MFIFHRIKSRIYGHLRSIDASPKPLGLWISPSEFSEEWKERIDLMAKYIDSNGVVADFGCGMMWLEPLLIRGNKYVPIDFIQRDERTIVVDLNRDPIPDVCADIAFFAGVLEYVIDIRGLIAALANKTFRRLILSYCTVNHFSDMEWRCSMKWVSHESLEGLLVILLPLYKLVAIDNIRGNTILVFDIKEL